MKESYTVTITYHDCISVDATTEESARAIAYEHLKDKQIRLEDCEMIAEKDDD